jgi:hypothetical protein
VGGNDGVVTIDIEEAPTRELNLIRAKDRSLPGVARALIAHVVENLSRHLQGTGVVIDHRPGGSACEAADGK